MGTFRVGVDIGGTFTDTVVVDEAGQLSNVKVPSTPPDFAEAIMEALRRLDRPLTDMSLFAHGTTVGINAIIARKGAKTAVVTTKGYRDTLALRRGDRGEQFDLWWKPASPIVPRRHRFEVSERISHAGAVVTPVDPDEVRSLARRLRRLEIEAVAIVLINSFVNPDHEEQIRAILAEELPDVYLSVSNEILREILEYERTATTTVNAYIGPVIDDYIEDLEVSLKGDGYDGGVVIATSVGGVATPDTVRQVPARTLESGPSAGVMAARQMCDAIGVPNVVTFDMGGTSLDLGIVVDGDVRRSNNYMIEQGTPVHFPCIDVFSIGAGGGSIAWIDAGGGLRNGPQSAGARPGPACYGTGGTEPTNTDAQVVLGRLDPNEFLGGAMKVHPELARDAILEKVGEPLGMDVEQAAAGILAIAHNNMTQSLRLATVERGYDPREFSIFAFGGGGPLYAAEVAKESSIPRVIVPRHPGLTSALGLLLIDTRHDVSESVLLIDRPEDRGDVLAKVNAAYERLEGRVSSYFAAEGLADADKSLFREADVRYFGQTESITVPVNAGTLDSDALDQLIAAFEEKQLREIGYVMPAEVAPVEIVNLRVAGIGRRDKATIATIDSGGDARDGLKGSRRVYFDGAFVDTEIYDRDALKAGMKIEGPAIVEQLDSTVAIPPGTNAEVDQLANLIIDTSAVANG